MKTEVLVLGYESSCDETGVALVRSCGDGLPQLLAHALHSQIEMHQAYGGVVPELASRDHIRRVLPLTKQVLAQSGRELTEVDVVAFTRGPGLAGALLVGAGVACALGAALARPVLGVHHLEGHLLSPFLSADPPDFPFVALLVSGGHTQLMRVDGVGLYRVLGETIDDAAGEAFDKSAKLLGLGYPGGPALARLAERVEQFDVRLYLYCLLSNHFHLYKHRRLELIPTQLSLDRSYHRLFQNLNKPRRLASHWIRQLNPYYHKYFQ